MSDLLAHLAHNPAHCPTCNYQLHGISQPLCPECGERLELGVVAPPRPLLPFTLAVTFIAMGLGFDAVVSTFLIGTAVASRFQSLPFVAAPVGILLFGAACCAASIWGLLRVQRHWFNAPRRTQHRRVVAVFFAVFAFHAALGLAVFLAV